MQLPFAHFLGEAFTEMYAERHERQAQKRWQSPLFFLVRLVKARPDMAGKTGKQAFQEVEAVMQTWDGTRKADWPKWAQVTRENAQIEFLDAWDRVRYEPGRSPLRVAHEHAQRCPLKLSDHIRDIRPDTYPNFISLAGWLQVTVGCREILLPLEAVGEILGVEKASVSRYRRWATKKDGYLREVKASNHARGQATQFVFDVSRFNVLLEQAEEGTAELFHGRSVSRQEVQKVIDYYMSQVRTAHPPGDKADRFVRALLLAGASERVLRDLAMLYGLHCDNHEIERVGRQSAGTFYSPDGNWPHLLEEYKKYDESRQEGNRRAVELLEQRALLDCLAGAV